MSRIAQAYFLKNPYKLITYLSFNALYKGEKLNKLIEFLQDPGGNISSNRLAFLLWTLGVLVTWIIVSISSKSLQPVDSSVAAVLGILMTGKVAQKFGEKPDEPGIRE